MSVEDFRCGERPERLRIVPCFSGIGKRVIRDVVSVREERVGFTVRVARSDNVGNGSRVSIHLSQDRSIRDSPPIVPKVARDQQIGPSEGGVLEIGGL